MNNDITFTTKSDFVFNTLKNKIINNEYRPGEKLIIRNIADELNVSIIPVREALKSLESLGLVTIEPHKSARVASISVDDLTEIILVRAGLEGYAAGLAATIIEDNVIDKLEELVNISEEAIRTKDVELFNSANMSFHHLIYESACLPLLNNIISMVWDSLKWTRSVFVVHPDRMKESLGEHKNILNALKSKDSFLSEKLVREHRLRAGEELKRSLLNVKNRKDQE